MNHKYLETTSMFKIITN